MSGFACCLNGASAALLRLLESGKGKQVMGRRPVEALYFYFRVNIVRD